MEVPALAQTPAIVPLDTLVANKGTVTAGAVTFSNFQKPTPLANPLVGIAPAEFNNVGVSAVTNADGTVSLTFTMIDPATGLPQPALAGGTAGGGEFVDQVSYTATVTDPIQRMKSVSQTFGPLSNVTGASLPFAQLYGVEPYLIGGGGAMYDGLRYDTWNTPGAFPISETLLPGGILPTYNMLNEFGIMKGHIGLAAGAVLDSFTVQITLAPVGTPVPLVVVNLGQHYAPFTSTLITDGLALDPIAGAGQIYLDNFAQDGGATITLTTDNPVALPLQPSVTVAQGSKYSLAFVLGPPAVDFPTDVNITASFNGLSTTHAYTATPQVPLQFVSFFGSVLGCTGFGCAQPVIWATPMLNRPNLLAETITFTSSLPALCPIQPSLTLAPLTPVGSVNTRLTITCGPSAVDTPVTFSGTMNGTTLSFGVTLPHVTDTATITKAELVVKNLSLKVEAFSNIPTAVLTLYDANSGAFIGTMTNSGLSGGGAKYSFQGTVPSKVTTLRVKSSFNGTSTFAVAQK